jgi:hypothetical protein
MDPTQFDRLVASLAQSASRRTAVAALLGGALAGVLGRAEAAPPAQRDRRRKRQSDATRDRQAKSDRQAQGGRRRGQSRGGCRDNGQRCQRHRECCSNQCEGGVCAPGLGCQPDGSVCQQNSDCCGGNCFGQRCAAKVTTCSGQVCSPAGTGCCAGEGCCQPPANQCNTTGGQAGLCCAPNCNGRECGPDGCGNDGTCGSCLPGQTCSANGKCQGQPSCKTLDQACTSAAECCSTDHTACAFNNVVLEQDVCCSTLGGACKQGGPSGDCCVVNTSQGQDYAYCSPNGACGGTGAKCLFNEACLSGQCCNANPIGTCSGSGGC